VTVAGAQAGAGLRGRRALWAAIAAALFLGAWVCLDHGWYAHGRIVDTPIYQGYGLQMRNGLLPYRDFSVEYPPGALPVFVAPTYFGQPTVPSDYQRWFARLMAACGLACLAFVLLSRPSRSAIIFVALSPLLVGQVMLSRFDLWPAAFVAAAVAAFLHDRHRLGWLALALAFVAKLYAVVLIPLAILWTLRRRGRDELVKGIAIWLVAVAAVFAPFAIVAPHGLWDGIWGQLSRPIQIESLVASLLTTFGSPRDAVSHNSVGIVGYGWLAALTTTVELACLVALWIGFARGPADGDRFVRYAAGCVAAFVAFGKVLSPQYLIWLVPLVPLVRGRRGLVASGLLALAMLVTQFWFTSARYAEYIGGYRYAPLVLSRNLLLVAILVVVAWPRRQVDRS
jgi:hypothetical protein